MPTVRTTTYGYEQSSEGGRERHVEVPYDSLTSDPVLHAPARVVCNNLATGALTGTIVTLDDADEIAVINVAKGAIYAHNVRNVLTYSGGSEATFGQITIGARVYYDPSSTMPAGCYLSLAASNAAGGSNTPFGWVVMLQDETANDFPKGSSSSGSTHLCAVLQG
jgi:hypothetical protein